ncbi:MAG: PilZ domain-containing protein [Candidatus Omnitrophota bacterium]
MEVYGKGSTMEGSPFIEKRTFTRFPINIPLTHSQVNSQQTACALTRDISAQGLCIIVDTKEKLTPGENIDICLQMVDNAEMINLKGRVAWSGLFVCDKQRVGIQLIGTQLKPISIVLRVLKSQRKY